MMTSAQIEAYVDAAAAALALRIDPGHRPGVIGYFTLAAEMADLLDRHPLGPADDPAGSFVPIGPRSEGPP